MVQAGRAWQAFRHLHQFRLDWDTVSRKSRDIVAISQCLSRRFSGVLQAAVYQYVHRSLPVVARLTDHPAGTSTESAAVVAGVGCGHTLFEAVAINVLMHNNRDRFIIDGIITLPIALYGFFVFPNTPTTTSAFYLSEKVRSYPQRV